MIKPGKTLIIAALALAACGIASASTIQTFTHTTTTQSVPFTDTFMLPGFDTTLGTLNSITIDLSTTATAEVDVFNATGSSQAFTNATAVIPITLTGPGPTTTSVNLTAGPVSGSAAPGFNAFPGLPASGSSSASVAPANFALYEGTGLMVTVNVNAGNGTFSGTSVPGVFFGGSATAGAVTTITYNYNAATTIPEPAAMTLLGSALLAIGLFRKRISRIG